MGTLTGVLITAVVGLLTTVVTLRSQRDLARQQASLQLAQQVRVDRKEAFVEYLSAYRLMYDSALRIAYDDEFASLRGKKVRTTTPTTFEATFPQVVSQFARSYYMLQIIAAGAGREAAEKANEALWALANGSFNATE